jgi:predicted nuclease of predicted toxin-antitoxin system
MYLADENIPVLAVVELRSVGIDIVSVSEGTPGIADSDVLQAARAANRVLLTFDKDFANLVFRDRLSGMPGIILLRTRPVSAEEITATLRTVLGSGRDWRGRFTVVSDRLVRSLPLPQ